MKMKIVLSEKMLNDLGYSIESRYALLDKEFEKSGVQKIDEGYYQGDDESFSAFSVMLSKMKRTDWIMLSAIEWFWWAESDSDEDKEDCLEVFLKLGRLPKESVYVKN